MGYKSWFISHGKKHQAIMRKLENLSDDEVLEYFCWDNMVVNEVDFCPLYKDNKKCHDTKHLNCYLCACPNFRFDDEAVTIKSSCSINSKDGKQIKTKSGAVHQDCSGCLVPHNREFIKKHFSRDWFKVMERVYDVKAWEIK